MWLPLTIRKDHPTCHRRIFARSQAATHEGIRFPWWSYCLAFFLSLVGAFLGTYIKRKAQDQAAKENFETLREQLRKNDARHRGNQNHPVE